ncbi:MAG: hypothetical protein IKK24_07030 [Clostridia bacterium]|nr:hypothetical protein [Clostridia bacterium]
MKKKIIIGAVIALLALLMLTVPFRVLNYKDGGTKEYTALTYKIVKWNKFVGSDGRYTEAKVYLFPKNFKSVDELWESEKENLPEAENSQPESIPAYSHNYEKSETFTATVKSISNGEYLVERAGGGEYIMRIADSTEIKKNNNKAKREDIEEGSIISITYDGVVMKSLPGQLGLVYLIEITE